MTTTTTKLFNCIKSSNSASEAAEKFLAPQKGRPIKNLENELNELISNHSGNDSWKSVVDTAKLVLKGLSGSGDVSPPVFGEKKEEETVVTKTAMGYLMKKGNREWTHSDKQIKFFREIIALIDSQTQKK